MKYSSHDAVTVRMYVPTGTDVTSVEEFVRHCGGCTINSGLGKWWDRAEDRWVTDQVIVYEIITYPLHASPHTLQDVGGKFLKLNPNEKEFLATVQAMGSTRKITVTRE